MKLLIVVIAVVLMTWKVEANWVKEMENPGLYEGDMVLSPDQMKEVKQGTFTFSSTSKKNKLWPNGVVPYTVNSDLARESEFKREFDIAIAQYHKYTCLRFKKRTNEGGYINFYKGGGCSSPVGYGGRRNGVSLSKGCWWRTTIMHEIAHSLGFHHEQSRPDRDNYVKILTHNIHSGTEHNFRKQNSYDVDSKGTPYDYLSMMHYSWNAFGKDQRMTIQTKDQSMQYEIGQDEGFSHIDIEQINRLYGCTGTYPTLPPYVKPPPGCYDLGGACVKGAWEGNCNKREWKSYMHSKCRKSCKLCGGGPRPSGTPVTLPPWSEPTTKSTTKKTGGGGNCRDRVVDCQRLGKHRCTDSNPVWKDYMERNCKKYCNKC
ncbi:zinc metalloproteinase nas-6-like [Hydractinia symbiolongicarpus]|uniref:zinc metalloproteinase nas-6-like n=1 Tax=Hydractinia symbiolongicarpus TaxID=13093 RepID=UPI0025501326|nr:zinc metalloproteinase nas-6-like [Hydractinia symbiolongicarpus]